MILVDTSVLSLAFRRAKTESEHRSVALLKQFIMDDWPVLVPGIVYQELLSGVKGKLQFDTLKVILQSFPVLLARLAHHESAASIRNLCQRKAIQVSAIDCLIAALAIGQGWKLLSTDSDFLLIAKVTSLELIG